MTLTLEQQSFKRQFDLEDSNSELVLLESVHAASQTSTAWPTFSNDPTNRYGLLLNLENDVYSFSLNSWIPNLEDELSDPTDSGAAFRLDILLESDKTTVDRIMHVENPRQEASLATSISLVDSDLGWLVLTSLANQPQAVMLDLPVDSDQYSSFAPDDIVLALPAPESRQPYQPAEAFFAPSSLPAFLDSVTQSANSRLRKSDLKTQVRFSPATLQLLTDAHRVLSNETSRLGAAAADLFRRCERMKLELAEQIRKVDEIAKRIESVTGDDDETANDHGKERVVGSDKIEQRMDAATDRSNKLQRRVETLRRKLASLGGKELSAREQAWADEVAVVDQSVGTTDGGGEDDGRGSVTSLTERFEAVLQLQRDLVTEAKRSANKRHDPDSDAAHLNESTRSVPLDYRKQRIEEVWELLERESALVDAVAERLGRLQGFAS